MFDIGKDEKADFRSVADFFHAAYFFAAQAVVSCILWRAGEERRDGEYILLYKEKKPWARECEKFTLSVHVSFFNIFEKLVYPDNPPTKFLKISRMKL